MSLILPDRRLIVVAGFQAADKPQRAERGGRGGSVYRSGQVPSNGIASLRYRTFCHLRRLERTSSQTGPPTIMLNEQNNRSMADASLSIPRACTIIPAQVKPPNPAAAMVMVKNNSAKVNRILSDRRLRVAARFQTAGSAGGPESAE
jgi:hypothetical protein